MKYLKILVVATGLMASATGAMAQAPGAFARMGFGARGLAMSNALVADASGETSPYYNPALAPLTSRQNIEVSAAFMTLDRELQFLQFAAPLRPVAGVAAGLIHAGVSNIDGRDASGYHTRDYTTDEFAFFLAFGLTVSERAALGVGLQFFRTDLVEDVSAVNSIGLDLGLSLRITEALRLGLAADDLLARYSWDTSDRFGSEGRTTSDRFPTRLRLGAAYQLLGEQLQLTAEYESRFTSFEVRTREVELVGDTPKEVVQTERLMLHDGLFRAGAEYKPVPTLAVRAGVDRIGAEAVSGVRPSAGFMVQQELGNLVARGEYAFVIEPYALGTMHLITLKVFL